MTAISLLNFCAAIWRDQRVSLASARALIRLYRSRPCRLRSSRYNEPDCVAALVE
jgi:hypothetical protein